VWYLFFYHCADIEPTAVYISGSSQWKNSFGYLAGSASPILKDFIFNVYYLWLFTIGLGNIDIN